jgi:hypothetical protein
MEDGEIVPALVVKVITAVIPVVFSELNRPETLDVVALVIDKVPPIS